MGLDGKGGKYMVNDGSLWPFRGGGWRDSCTATALALEFLLLWGSWYAWFSLWR